MAFRVAAVIAALLLVSQVSAEAQAVEGTRAGRSTKARSALPCCSCARAWRCALLFAGSALVLAQERRRSVDFAEGDSSTPARATLPLKLLTPHGNEVASCAFVFAGARTTALSTFAVGRPCPLDANCTGAAMSSARFECMAVEGSIIHGRHRRRWPCAGSRGICMGSASALVHGVAARLCSQGRCALCAMCGL
eukprot:evm.model.scf_314EXC.1 EVM.evm.TU.scf_314EXC.1   scf_314EXC:3926-4507(+)